MQLFTVKFQQYGVIVTLFIALMLGGAPQMWGQTQDTSRLLWTRNFDYLKVSDAKFFPDGDRIAVSFTSYDGYVKQNFVIVLSTETGEILDTLDHIGKTAHLQFSKDGRYLYDATQKYDLIAHRFIDSIPDHLYQLDAPNIALSPTKDEIYMTAFHKPGGYGSSLDSNLSILDANTLEPKKVKTVNAWPGVLTITKDGKYLIVYEYDTGCCYDGPTSYDWKPLSNDKVLVLRDAETLEESTTIPKNNKYGRYGIITSEERSSGSFTISPDGKLLASHNYLDSIYLWSTEDWKFIGGFKVPLSSFYNILFSCNSKYIMTYYYDGYKNSIDTGIIVYSVQPPFDKAYKFPYRDQNGQESARNPHDILCIQGQGKLIASRNNRLYLLTVPDFITGVEKGEGPKKQDLIYPNPTNGDISIIFNEPLTEATNIQIANEQGAIVYQTMLKPGSAVFRWNTSKLSSGMYLCTVRNKTIFSTYKIMVGR